MEKKKKKTLKLSEKMCVLYYAENLIPICYLNWKKSVSIFQEGGGASKILLQGAKFPFLKCHLST